MAQLPQQIAVFLEQHSLATIATVPQPKENGRFPHVTCIFYVSDKLGNIYFVSHHESNKLQNIIADPHVGVVITDQTSLATLRLEGIATLCAMDDNVKDVTEKLASVANEASYPQLPPFMQLNKGPGQLVKIAIKHFYYSLFSEINPVITAGNVDETV